MPNINILTESDLRQVVTLDTDVMACVEDAFRALATKPVVMPVTARPLISEVSSPIAAANMTPPTITP